MSLAAFAEYLCDNREAVIAQWETAVRTNPEAVPSAQRLTREQLSDHLAPLLERIARALEGAATPEVEPEGREHGSQRRRSGYDIAEVLREHTLLRQTLLDWLSSYAAGHPGLSHEEREQVRQRLIEVIDRSGQAAAAQYHAEAIAECRELERELEAAGRQKDRFLAMLSHELRNPLAPILNAAKMLRQAPLADPRLERAGEIIERQAIYQARLIDDLLDVNRIAQGKIALRRESVDLRAAIGQAVETCLPAIEAKGLALTLDVSAQPLMITGDPVRLAQIVTNVLNNAGRYTNAPGAIALTAGLEKRQAVVRVKDTGVGIAPEMLPRVFDLFVQADTSLDRRQGGLGLGLALAKNLAEMQGGAVEARSEGLGAGSEFIIRLPLARTSETAADAALASTVEREPISRHVLLVDDQPDARTSLADVLEMLGHHVFTAANGPEALRLAWEEQPEVAIVDIGLPGMTGYELAQQLRRIPGGDRARLIALTGYGSPEDKERARQAGFDAHLTKPADFAELERLLGAPVEGSAPYPPPSP
jgi:signal transduction histidine kinase/CheY-like chemotaxis protein